MKQYGVVVIGCGYIGTQHLAELYYRDAINLIGVVDQNEKTAQECQRRYHAKSFNTDYHDYLRDARVDIVIIATYTDTHLEIAKAALAAKKHVICEKPIACNAEDGAAFVRIVKESQCKVLVSHILRHNATYQYAAQLIHTGAIGHIKSMRMVQNHHSLDWQRYKRLLCDCTPVLDCGVHYFDVMQWFAESQIVAVSGFGARIDNDLPADAINYCVANVRLENGAVGYYEVGWSRCLPSSNVKEFIGDKGYLQIILNAARTRDTEEGDLIRLFLQENGEYRTINIASKYKNMWAQMQCLIDMIEKDCPAWPDIDAVYSAFKVALAAQTEIKLFGNRMTLC